VTPHQIVTVALRLFAIWLGIESLRTVLSFFVVDPSSSPSYVYMTFLLGLTVTFSLAMWFFPSTIAGKILPSQSTQSPPSATLDTWLAMGCSLMGLWILVTSIPRLALDLYALNRPFGTADGSPVARQVFYYSSEALVALWLVFGGKGFRKLFWWAQNAGTNNAL
jgi:hypothetical protein